jgi:predicted PurR-regulated permease PerM
MKINYESTYIKWGLTAIVVLCSTIIFFFTVFRLTEVFESIHLVLKILMPFVYGLVIAYLLCPVYNFFTRHIYRGMLNKFNPKTALTMSRVLSTTITITMAIVVVAGLVSMVLPQILDSLIILVKTAPDSLTQLIEWSESKLSENKDINAALKMLMGDYTTEINNWLQEEVLPWLLGFAAQISTGIIDIVRFFKDFLIGIIICIYFLNSKELFKAQSKKLMYALLRKNNARNMILEMGFINKTFSGFISGKIIDSVIIGLICFVTLSIIGTPYLMLVSVVVGVTNIIPFFGPFIGAIPSTIIILTASPIDALYFIIFILILQQIDGNIIGPKILGDSTGLPSFWVMFAILLGGGLFGFPGMVVGIPIFAVLYAYFSRAVDSRLRSKNLPVETDIYKDLSNYDESGRKPLDEI